jgi:tetraacyldisaccharide 4'-kinase
VDGSSDPKEVGDEPVLLAGLGLCSVWVSPDRVEAAESLLANGDCDVVVCDDGMQHYRLERDIEIAVIDGHRRFGNGACLPAGPLREPPERLREVDFVVANGVRRDGEYLMTLEGDRAICLTDSRVSRGLAEFQGERLHAVAGIGNPERFFSGLRRRGLQVTEHVFPDHHDFQAGDLAFGDGLPVLMTEKDAVKCRTFARDGFWYVPVRARLDPALENRLLARLRLRSTH